MQENQCTLNVKDSMLGFILSFVFFQLAAIVFSLLFTTIASAFAKQEWIISFLNTNAWGYLLLSVVANSAMVITFVALNKNKQNKIVSKPKANKLLVYILIAILAFFMLYPIVVCTDTLLAKWNVPLGEIGFRLNKHSLFPSFLALVVIAPVCEELLFRGLIFKGLKNYGKAFSITITALLFTLFHCSLNQFINPMVMGLLLTSIMYKENNILYTIAMHATCNLLAYIVSYFNLSLYYNHFSYIIIAILLFALALTLLIIYIAKNNKNSKTQKLNQNKGFFVFCMALIVLVWLVVIVLKIVEG